MKTTSRSLALFIGIACLVSTASAHYLWVKLLHKEGTHGTTNIYFEGGPGPGTGEHLDPFIERGKTWLRTPENPKGKLLEMEIGKKPKSCWLTTGLGEGAPRSIDSYGKWGDYKYGKTDVLLHYHARLLDVATAAELKQLARAGQLELDIVPQATEAGMQLTLFWRGKPVAGRAIIIRGPKGFRQNPKTNKEGIVSFKPEAAGTYLFRTNVDEKASGTFGGKEFQLKRCHVTMSFDLPLEK